jgi:nucleotide-binding universal stress UspA family protein
MLKPTKILVPTDFSEYSDRALRQALDIARQYGAKVYILHVLREEMYRFEELGNIADTWKIMEDSRLARARENLQKQLGKFPQAKEVEVIADIRKGLHYEAILEEASQRAIDLIVIASLGQSGIAKYLIGSVARNVLKGSKCPVLLTK